MNCAIGSAGLPPRPIPDSLSHTQPRGTAWIWPETSCHIPISRSAVVREGSIIAVMNRECEQTITNTGGVPSWPAPSGIRAGGNHRSHWTWSPGRQESRPAGSTGAYWARRGRRFSRTQVIAQPTRSAGTVAGILGCSTSNARTTGSTRPNAFGPGDRSYRGGRSEATALITMFRHTPNRSAICVFGTPSACNRRINAQPSTVITLQSPSAHFSTVRSAQYSSVVDITTAARG